MTSHPSSQRPQRSGSTVAGLLGVALAGVLLFCGAGHVPIENFTPQGTMQADLNAGGCNITNTATLSATNVVVSGTLTGSGAQLTGLHGYASETLAAAGTSTLAGLGRVSEDTVTLAAGTGAYTVNRSLADSGARAGDVWLINVAYPASTNPTLNIYDNSTSGTLLLSSAGTAIAGSTTLEFVFNGTSWVHYAKGAVLTKNLGTGVQTALGNGPNTANGLAGLDSNGDLPLDPWSQVNYTPAQQEIVFMGDSISGGFTLSTPLTQCYPYQFSQLPWARNHATYYNFSSGGAIVASGYSQGGTSPVTPTTQSASWTGTGVTTITLSASNANIAQGEFVYGTGIPFGTRVTSISGTTLVLNPAIGYTGTIASEPGGVTLSFIGNNITDLYTQFVHPLRPSNVAGVKRAFLFVHCGVNDLGSGIYNPATLETALSSFIATAQADGFIVIPDTISPLAQGTVLNWSYFREYQRWQFNDWLRSGASGVPSAYVHDAAAVYTANTASPDAMTPDGLHPSLAAHVLLANDLNNFMQADGGMTRYGSHHFELAYDESGLVVGPTNNTFSGDNFVLTYNSGGNTQGYLLNNGIGEGTLFNGGELDDFVTSSGSAGQLVVPLITVKRMAGGLLAVGGNVSSVSGSTSGATVIINGATGTITTAGLSTPPAPTVAPGGTTGSSTYAYAYVAVAADGVTHSAPSPTTTITNGNAVLTSNQNNITLQPVPGAASYWLYRVTTTGSGNQGTTGKWYSPNLSQFASGAGYFSDYGNLAGTGSLPSTASAGQAQVNSVTVQLGTGTGTTTLGSGATTARTISFPDASGTVGLLTKITGTLSGGTATITNAAVLAASAIHASHLGTSAANAGALYVSALSTGSVTIKSTNGSDNDTFVLTVQ